MKDQKIRIDGPALDALDALATEAEGDPDIVVKLGDSSGKISRSAMARECLSRGMASVRGALRARPEPAPKPTPTKPAPKARKPAKRKRTKR